MELLIIKSKTEAGEALYLEKADLDTSFSIDPERNYPQIIWIDSFLSLTGSCMYDRENGREPNDIDIVVRADPDEDGFCIRLDAALRLKIDRIMAARFDGKETQWIGSPTGPNWKHQPIYDLALIPRKIEEPVEINEPDFAAEFYKAKHRRDQCMDCSKEPEFEILWAEGMGHAWFCSIHLRDFIKKNKEDIDAIKVVRDETASIKFQNNREPNQRDKIIAEFARFYKLSTLIEDLKKPEIEWRRLISDLRYLGNSAYPKLTAGKNWGDWTLEKVLKTFASIVDKLRSVYFTIIPPKMGDPGYSTAYWKCYRSARKYMKSNPPKKDDISNWNTKRGKLIQKDFEKEFSVFAKASAKDDERIVCGIVYVPDEKDLQGDRASAKEIKNAAWTFMESGGVFRFNHGGKEIKATVLETFLAPMNYTVQKNNGGYVTVKKGSWVLTARVNDPIIWKQIKSGVITGYSMAGKHR